MQGDFVVFAVLEQAQDNAHIFQTAEMLIPVTLLFVELVGMRVVRALTSEWHPFSWQGVGTR